MFVRALDIADIKLLAPVIHRDERGTFCETYSKSSLRLAGIDADFVQDNHSLSRATGTVRGLHYQNPPHAQGKLIRVIRGAVFDVAVDIRQGSPTYGRHVTMILSAANGHQAWVPVGFAHGFCTLEPDTEVIYKVTADYAPASDAGIRWDDPALGIPWPVLASTAVLSAKDLRQPLLANVTPAFHWTPV